MSGRTRVVQWATGNIGLRGLREVIRHPDLELVGVLVYDPDKDGVDAGVLCGEGPVGVTATTDRAAIIGLAADCALHMPRRFELDDVVALLERGTNVITTRGVKLFAGGVRLGADRDRVVAACEQGDASVYATGSSPGFITDVLPFALLSLQRHVESIEIEEYANLSKRDSPHMLFRQMGFGRPVEGFDTSRASYLLEEFRPPLERLAAAAGRPADDWSAHGEVAAARHDTALVAGDLPAGTVAAQRTVITGSTGGDPVVRFTANWYCTPDVEPDWDLRPTGWRVRVRGDAPLDVELPFPVPLEDLGAYTPAYTANRPVNAIPYVCAAPPGILTTEDLPVITPAGPGQAEIPEARTADQARALWRAGGSEPQGRGAHMTSIGLITGAARGIGEACARRIAGTVDRMVLVDVDHAGVDATAAEIAAIGTASEGIVIDITDPAGVRLLADRLREQGDLRSVAHIAGISPTMAGSRRVYDVDLVGTALLVDAIRPLARAGTAVVCFASMAAYVGASDNPAADAAIDAPLAPGSFEAWAAAVGDLASEPGMAYAWAKRGVQRLVRREASAFGAVGARICSVSPGMVDTPMGRQEYAQQPFMKTIEEMTPLRRTAHADELAAVVAFLLSDDASFVTGIDLLADGGAVAAIGAG